MSTGEHDSDSPISTAEENENEQARAAAGAQGEAEGEAEAEAPKPKLDLDVQIQKTGPCKKKIVVAIAREEIKRQFEESLHTMKREAQIPGFRPGHAPRTLIEKRFRKQVGDQVKAKLVIAALEQLEDDFALDPITPPNLDIEAITLPDDGPLRFDIEIEVRPDFDLPVYKGLTVHRPVKTLTDADVDSQLNQFLERYGQKVPKLTEGAEIGDFLTVDMTFHRAGQVFNTLEEKEIRLQPEFRLQDGSIPRLGEALTGARPGESRETEVVLGTGSPDPSLRGHTIGVTFQVKDLKQMRLPELNAAFLSSIGFENLADLRGAIKELLERRLKTQQRDAMRREIMDRLIQETPFDLPPDLVARQESVTLQRMVMDMQRGGLNENEIRAREAEIRINARESTLRGLKESFILAKIADAEDLKVEEADLDNEIEAIAEQSDESPRRVRSRIEKEGLTQSLMTQILERRTLDKILEGASYREVPLIEEGVAVETIDQTATVAPPDTGEGEGEAEAEGQTAGAAGGASESAG
jgi:trigger factor